MSHAGLTCRSSPQSALCTFLEPESCFVVCGGRGLSAAGGLGNSLCLSGPLKQWCCQEPSWKGCSRTHVGHQKGPNTGYETDGQVGTRTARWSWGLSIFMSSVTPAAWVTLLVAFLMLNDHVQRSSSSGHAITGQAFSGALEGLWSSSSGRPVLQGGGLRAWKTSFSFLFSPNLCCVNE